MSRFQLASRRSGGAEVREHHIRSGEQPRIGGRRLLDGEPYEIRGEERVVRHEAADKWDRFTCTLAVGVNA